MKKLILKINHSIFNWYYKRCGDHFKQYTFFKSVKLVIDNYEHLKLLMKNEVKHNRNLTRDNDEMRKELFDIKIKQIAGEDQVDWMNSTFGMGINKANEN